MAVGLVGLVFPVVGVMEAIDGEFAEYCICINTWRGGWGCFHKCS